MKISQLIKEIARLDKLNLAKDRNILKLQAEK